MSTLTETIKKKLTDGLNPLFLQLIDDSARHEGHAGHNGAGESHFKLTLVSERFEGLSRVARHQLVYGLLSEEMATHVHALQISATTPAEYNHK